MEIRTLKAQETLLHQDPKQKNIVFQMSGIRVSLMFLFYFKPQQQIREKYPFSHDALIHNFEREPY
jgi:hypothetical protein